MLGASILGPLLGWPGRHVIPRWHIIIIIHHSSVSMFVYSKTPHEIDCSSKRDVAFFWCRILLFRYDYWAQLRVQGDQCGQRATIFLVKYISPCLNFCYCSTIFCDAARGFQKVKGDVDLVASLH